MFPRHDGFLLCFLPKVEGRWAPLLKERRHVGVSPRGDLAALEEAGATHEEIALLVQDYFYSATATFRGLGNGFTKKGGYRDDDPRMALWLMDLLHDPWPVIEVLGTHRERLFQQLLSTRPASEWISKADLVGIPEVYRPLIGPDGLRWTGPAPFPQLPWWPNPLGGGLHLEYMEGPLPIQEDFQWSGTLRLRDCSDIGHLRLSGGPHLRLESCPGLRTLMVSQVERVEISRCPDLISVELDQGGPLPGYYPKPPVLQVDGECLHSEFPWPAATSRLQDLEVGLLLEDCPSLTNLQVGFGDVALRRCDGLQVLRRGGPGSLWISDCRSITELRVGPGDVFVRNCPMLERVYRNGTGRVWIESCPSLTHFESHFSKAIDPTTTVSVRACPALLEIRSQSLGLRHCGETILEDCSRLGSLPYLRVHGSLTIRGCPQLDSVPRDRRSVAWIIGTRLT